MAQGEIERAIRWADRFLGKREPTPLLAQEREEVALVRVLLTRRRAAESLMRLAPLLEQAAGQGRWGHVIEMRLLEALAFQVNNQEPLALASLAQAVQLAEPEGYICSFVEDGSQMAALLTSLQDQQRRHGPTPYLDTVLAAFPQAQQPPLEVPSQHQSPQPLQDPLTERERQVLLWLARGASNQEIAERLVITIDTVKRHVTHIYSKLEVTNRVQAVERGRTLGLLADLP
jgi:LuxR family maltose regulon positive regulatory protein